MRPTVLAHGIGGRQDLPVPVSMFVLAAAVVLVVSFVALAVLWPTARLQEPEQPRRLGGRWQRPASAILSVIGLLGLVMVVVAGLFGIDNSSKNPASVLVFVDWWLVIPFLAAFLINLYPVINPWRYLLSWFGAKDTPPRGGYEPAALVLLAFTWLELVSPRQGPRVLALMAVAYTVYIVIVGLIRGRTAVSENFDGFAVYSRLFASMAPFTTDDEGRWWRQKPFRALAFFPERSGLDFLAIVMIGSVSYDGAKSTEWWQRSIVEPLIAMMPTSSPVVLSVVIGTIGLFGVVGLVGLAYRLACWAAARLGGSEQSAARVSIRFAHSLVPIAFAYAFAHYFTLVLFEGQLLLSTLSDPLGRGWDLFGTADRDVSYALITTSSAWVWYVQVLVIVAGHVGGVILAHDRALVDFEGPYAVRSQFAMLVLMIALTGLGLVLLSSG